MLLRLMQAVAEIDDPDWIICSRNEVKTYASRFPSDQIHMICNNDKGKAKSISVFAIFQPTEEQLEMFIEMFVGRLPDLIRNSLAKAAVAA